MTFEMFDVRNFLQEMPQSFFDVNNIFMILIVIYKHLCSYRLSSGVIFLSFNIEMVGVEYKR